MQAPNLVADKTTLVVPDAVPPQETLVAKPPTAAVGSKPPSGLKRLLDSFAEPRRKKPRLAGGEMLEWDAELKFLFDWMDKYLPHERQYSKIGISPMKCSEEKLAELERAL
jgi:hypothetical protein